MLNTPQTTIRVDKDTRDKLAATAYIAGVTLGELLEVLSHTDPGVVLGMTDAWKEASKAAGQEAAKAASRASRGLK